MVADGLVIFSWVSESANGDGDSRERTVFERLRGLRFTRVPLIGGKVVDFDVELGVSR